MGESEDIRKRSEEYRASLFHGDREENDDIGVISYESGPSILKGVQLALQNSKTGKAGGPDDVVVEMLIALQENGVDLLWKLFNKIYEIGQIPPELVCFHRYPPKNLTLWNVKTTVPSI